MKRQLLILALFLAAAAALIWLLPSQPLASPRVRFTFVGFTNSPTGPEALFSVKDWPKEDTGWMPREVSYREGNVWKRWPTPPNLRLWIPAQTNIMVALRVPATNQTLRTVIELQSEPGGLKKKINGVFRLTGVRFRPFPFRCQSVTNEVRAEVTSQP